MKVEILRGCSGSGKTTFAEALLKGAQEKGLSGVILSADNFMVGENNEYAWDFTKLGECHNRCLRVYAEIILENYRSATPHSPDLIIVDNTNTRISEFAPYAALARAFGVPVSITTFLSCAEWAHSRNTHNTPLASVKAQENRLRESLKEMSFWEPHTVVDLSHEQEEKYIRFALQKTLSESE